MRSPKIKMLPLAKIKYWLGEQKKQTPQLAWSDFIRTHEKFLSRSKFSSHKPGLARRNLNYFFKTEIALCEIVHRAAEKKPLGAVQGNLLVVFDFFNDSMLARKSPLINDFFSPIILQKIFKKDLRGLISPATLIRKKLNDFKLKLSQPNPELNGKEFNETIAILRRLLEMSRYEVALKGLIPMKAYKDYNENINYLLSEAYRKT